jgi:hypothetical protein
VSDLFTLCGYRGHNAPPDHKMKVYVSGPKRGVTEAIKRDMRRRSPVEPVIGHAKGEHRLRRLSLCRRYEFQIVGRE